MVKLGKKERTADRRRRIPLSFLKKKHIFRVFNDGYVCWADGKPHQCNRDHTHHNTAGHTHDRNMWHSTGAASSAADVFQVRVSSDHLSAKANREADDQDEHRHRNTRSYEDRLLDGEGGGVLAKIQRTWPK